MNKRMRMKRRQAERKKIHKILDLAMEKNKENPTVFLEFSGHVNSLDVSVYRCGWYYGMKSDKEFIVYLDKHFRGDASLDNIISYLEAL